MAKPKFYVVPQPEDKTKNKNKKKNEKRKKIADPEWAQAIQRVRSSGMCGAHEQGMRGARTRRGAKAAAIRESRGQ